MMFCGSRSYTGTALGCNWLVHQRPEAHRSRLASMEIVNHVCSRGHHGTITVRAERPGRSSKRPSACSSKSEMRPVATGPRRPISFKFLHRHGPPDHGRRRKPSACEDHRRGALEHEDEGLRDGDRRSAAMAPPPTRVALALH